MRKLFEKFREKVKKEIPNIELGYREFVDEDYVQIFYYQEEKSENLSKILGEALGEVFYSKDMFNVGLWKVIKERREEYFPFFCYQEDESESLTDNFDMSFSDTFDIKKQNIIWFNQKKDKNNEKINQLKMEKSDMVANNNLIDEFSILAA